MSFKINIARIIFYTKIIDFERIIVLIKIEIFNENK